MGKYITQQDKEDSFRSIVLAHLKRILELSSHELRDHTRKVTHTNHSEIIEQEDTRLSYVSAVESLAYILEPHFDEDTQETFNECIPIIEGFSFEIKELLEEELEIIREKSGKSLTSSSYIALKLRYAKKLFRALNKLLKTNDYLSSEIFTENE